MYPVLVREYNDSTVVIHVSGEIDNLSCDEIESTILCAVPLWNRVVIDAAKVTFCCSTGLNMFIRCEEAAAQRDCQLVIVHPSPQLERVITITGLTRLLAA
jgi:anti-sigma B factor antagonist